MIGVPSTLDKLIARLDDGEDLTPEELRRAQQLQALHIAKAGEDFAREAAEREDEADEQLRQVLGV